MNKEGYFNHKTKTFIHITKNCIMDCNPISYKYILNIEKEIERYKKFVDDILNFYKHNRYEEELTEDNMFKLVLNQNEMIMTIEEFKGGK